MASMGKTRASRGPRKNKAAFAPPGSCEHLSIWRVMGDKPLAKAIRPVRVEGDTVYIPLSQGLETAVDICDLATVEGINWHAAEDHCTFYAVKSFIRGSPRGTQTRLHRIIMQAPPDLVVDHIDGNGLNNRRSNLRVVTQRENLINRGKFAPRSSRYKGVSFESSRGLWRASIWYGERHHHLGRYSSEEAAYEAYCIAALKNHGEFANLG